jgi:hypothetical protein
MAGAGHAKKAGPTPEKILSGRQSAPAAWRPGRQLGQGYLAEDFLNTPQVT